MHYRKKMMSIFFKSFLTLVILLILNYLLYNLNLLNVKSLDDQSTSIVNSNNQSNSTADTSSDATSDNANTSSQIEDNSPTINPDDWNLVLVNFENPIADNFQVDLYTLSDGKQVDQRIVSDLTRMLNDADSLGYPLVICSAYRTIEYQNGLFEAEVSKQKSLGYDANEAVTVAKTVVAQPTTSEHHTGLAVDIVALAYQNLNEELLQRPEIQWLYENCYQYGFIVRYPPEKMDVTGIIHEPWHYRYVGVEVATYLTQNNLTLEEYLQSAE